MPPRSLAVWPSPIRPRLVRRMARVTCAVLRVLRALEGRRQVRRLGHMDARALKDIGLLPSDIVGALELPLHSDPSTFLMRHSLGRAGQIHPSVAPPDS